MEELVFGGGTEVIEEGKAEREGGRERERERERDDDDDDDDDECFLG